LQPLASSFNDGRRNRELARTIEGARTSIRARLNTPTVLLDVLADELIERCAAAFAAGDLTALEAWVEAMCAERSGAPAVHDLFLSLEPALTATLGARGFGILNERLRPIVSRLRLVRPAAPVDTVDELDLLLADMVSRVESNDPMTAEHCRAVSAWCVRIAQRLALPRAEAAFVARGGLIHDVGKSITPLEILQAPRKLTEAEWIVMREHVTNGYDIVRGHEHLRDFSPVVRSHHERFEGGGYPDNLDRARIPIAVRIVTVADAFNAMIGRRPYRTPLSPDRAMAELRRNAGTQFDPNVVAALIDVVGAGHQPVLTGGAVA
jgi:putative nucleotidyltransferase with HDIG domain